MHSPFYTAFITSVQDPMKVGRVQVRVAGLHDDIFNTEALPWALVVMPSTAAAYKGVGTSPTWLVPMTQVIVFFLDNDYQQPMVLGVVGADEDIHPLAVEKYPYNKVINTPSGHLIEIDDSPGDSRLFVKHKSGSYVLIKDQGDIEIWTKGNMQIVSEKDTSMLVQGDLKIDVENNATISVKNRASVNVGDSADIRVVNNVSLMCPSITMTEISTQFERAISDNLTLYQREGVYGVFDDVILRDNSLDIEDSNQLVMYAPVDTQNVLATITSSQLADSTQKIEQAVQLEKDTASQLSLIEKTMRDKIEDASVLRDFVETKNEIEKLIAQIKAGIDQARETVENVREAINQRVQQIQQKIDDIQDRIVGAIESSVIFQQLQSLKNTVQNLTESIGLPVLNILDDLGLSEISQELYSGLADLNFGLAANLDIDQLTRVYRINITQNFSLLDLANDGFGNAVRLLDNVESGTERGNRILNNLGTLANYLENVNKKYPGMNLQGAFRNLGDDSDHSTGLAADITWDNMSNEQIALVAKDLAESLPTKAVSLQYGSKTWIHLSLHESKKDYSSTATLYTRINDQALEGLVILGNE